MTHLARIIVAWMIATTLHAPFPVCDGDTLGSNDSTKAHVQDDSRLIDIDFVLLGCDPPDDPDDGPIDPYPEDGSTAFGFQCTRPPGKADLSSRKQVSLDSNKLFRVHVTRHGNGGLVPCEELSFPRLALSFGRRCRYGMATMRC